MCIQAVARPGCQHSMDQVLPPRYPCQYATKAMLQRFLSLFAQGRSAKDRQRSRLLARYPSHLDLLDSGEIPHEQGAGPDLSYFTESARYYYDLIVASAVHFKDKPRALTDAEREMSGVAYSRFVNGTWGLIARGAEAIPFAVQLLRSADRDHREAAANVFCGLRDARRLPEVVSQIASRLQTEADRLVVDSLLAALGSLGSRDAIPAIARFVLNPSEDGDTRNTAAVSLGKIVKRRFDKRGADPVPMACDWLAANGYGHC